ncbi:MAG: DUF6538 domain-containing protein [Pseudomonadota bacterium]
MASPIRRDGSSVHYLRKRVPADLTPKAVGLVLHVPVGPETAAVRVGSSGTIKVSLRSHDPREAKARQAKALAYLDDMWRALRAGPQRLNNRQVVALAGEWYRAAKATWENDPGRATLWGILKSAAQNWDVETVQREMAPFVAEVLAERALNVDDDSRARLAKAMHSAFRDATGLLERRARGDYGPDEVEQRFPAWQREGAREGSAVVPVADLSITELFERWEREALATGKTKKTVNEYRAVINRLIAFLDFDDAKRVTPRDIVAYKDMRLASTNLRTGMPIAPKTVKDVELAALKSVFGWGLANHHLPANPAESVKLKLGKKRKERPKGYTDKEAITLLTAANGYKRVGREHKKTAAAKRWAPWLCAFTGARISEIIQLRKEDVTRSEECWVLRLTPEAGTIKDKEFRDVPLHPQLVELGFPEFVAASNSGYLFLNAKNVEEAEGRSSGVTNRVSEFVRTVVDDRRVRPNHAWRHRLVSLCRRHGVDQELRRMITGHAGEGVDETEYGEPEGLYREICKLPPYPIAGLVRS